VIIEEHGDDQVSEVGVTEETPFQRFVTDGEALASARRYEIGVSMRDGIELAADVYLPAEADHGPVPAIAQVTPYDKSNILLAANEGRFYQSCGYAYVAVDYRGRGKSEGVWNGFANDVPETHDVIEWVAAQRWCDEKLGTTGISYMGWVRWAGASESPPRLRAMLSTSTAGRWQQEIPYTNGIFQLYFAWWAHGTRRRIDESYRRQQIDWEEVLRRLPFKSIGEVIDTATNMGNNLADRDTLDDFWKNLRFDDRYDQINVPCLHVIGWYDQEDLLGALVYYPDARIERIYDHHGVINAGHGPVPTVGDRLALIPNHVCPVTNLARELIILDDNGDEVDRCSVGAGLRNI
jgi:putative CocE/NonD family hydrolase